MTRRARAEATAATSPGHSHQGHPSRVGVIRTLSAAWRTLRRSEKILIAYFGWSALTALAVRRAQSWPAVVFALLIFMVLATLARRHTGPLARMRPWVPLALILPAYWQADAIGPVTFIPRLDELLKDIDGVLRADALREWVWASGPVLPATLELVYLMLYVVPPVAWFAVHRAATPIAFERFASTFLLGTFGAYALLPYFPAQSPLSAPFEATSAVAMALRSLNIWLLEHAGIRENLPFPSGHVATAFATAFGVYRACSTTPWRSYGACLLAYAAVLSVATVYGRYHYAADAIAGFVISGMMTLILGCLDRPAALRSEKHM